MFYSLLNLSGRWGGWLAPRPGRFTPGNEVVPIAWKDVLGPRPVITCDVIPGCLASIQSIYRLRYPCPQINKWFTFSCVSKMAKDDY